MAEYENNSNFKPLGKAFAKDEGVQSLSNRPNANTAYGTAGLSAEMLKKRFDVLPTAVIAKIDHILNSLGKTDDNALSAQISTGIKDIKTLQDFFNAVADGRLADVLTANYHGGYTGESLNEILLAIGKDLGVVNINDPQSGLRLYIDNPNGEVDLSDTRPVSGRAVAEKLKQADGEVEEGNDGLISGGKVHDALYDLEVMLKNLIWYPEGKISPDEPNAVAGATIYHRFSQTDSEIESNKMRLELLEHANEGNTYKFETINTYGLTHDVPATALPYAVLNSLGGYTVKTDDGLKSAKVKAVKSYGANLADLSAVHNGGGIIFDNGTLTVITPASSEGRASDATLKDLCPNMVAGENYFLSANSTGNSKLIYLKGEGANQSWEFGKSRTVTQAMLDSLIVFYASGESTKATITEFMINKGTTALPYSPYSAEPIDTYFVRYELQSLDGYGHGVNGYPSTDITKRHTNTIDFVEKTYTEQAREIVLTGDEEFSTYFNPDYGLVGVTWLALEHNYNKTYGLCTDATVRTWTSSTPNVSNSLWVGAGTKYIYWIDALNVLGLSTIAEFKAYVKERYESGNPVRIVYALYNGVDSASHYIEHDISEHIPDTVYLKVEAGGYLVAENDDGVESKLGITYQLKL